MYDSIVHIGEILFDDFYKEGFQKNTSRYFAAVIPSLLKMDMKQKAKHFIDIYERESGYFDSLGNIEHGREAFYNCKGEYYEATNRHDSAEHYFRKELTFGKDYMNQNMASKELSGLFLRMNKPDSAAKYALYSYAMNDSVYAQMATAEVEKAHNIYNYTRHKELAVQEKVRADREHSQFLYMVMVFICSSALFLFIVWKKRREREAERKDYEKNKATLRKLQEEKENLEALAADYLNQKKELEESLEDKFNAIINEKTKEIKQLEYKIFCYNQSLHTAKDTVEMHFINSDFHAILQYKLKRGMKLSDKDLCDLDGFAQQYMPKLYAFLTSNGVLDEKKYRTCYLFRLHLNVKAVSNLLGVSSPYISQISKEMFSSLFSDSGSSKELKKEIEKFDMDIRDSYT